MARVPGVVRRKEEKKTKKSRQAIATTSLNVSRDGTTQRTVRRVVAPKKKNKKRTKKKIKKFRTSFFKDLKIFNGN